MFQQFYFYTINTAVSSPNNFVHLRKANVTVKKYDCKSVTDNNAGFRAQIGGLVCKVKGLRLNTTKLTFPNHPSRWLIHESCHVACPFRALSIMFRYFAFNFLDIIIGVLYYGSTGSAIELRSLLVIIHNVNLLPAGKNVSCTVKTWVAFSYT